ncbi:hypothetical protein [Spiroplasma citri]|uniref:Phage portal protein n=2 Tax=Spiroplasma citri TaxID=2133 RepID=A0A5B8XIJ7_SPICI|nr:hypothetical protein [Spiroplasma citri]QED24549.1 hypothetical protein FRX96_03680 [Spiroplasma citri]QED24817.1 hypothetical protein FRX96_05225 [Spiroplasma citri]QIA66732.1 hypothetical protein GMI18_03165 [Spiroplasma citri]QIA66975.1 hypothetical protein GMI18_04500 [Spiroplasma citri]QIA67021.1 hypothetical protein GMI18_04785 [Spiroplasma citri]
MGLLPAKKKIKKEYDIDSYYLNLASTISNRKNVNVQKHNEILEKRICEDNANFLNPRELEISISNPVTNQKLDTKLINNFLKMQDFTNKNWYNEYKINKYGKGAYFIFVNNSKLNFITIDFYNDQYDELGNLVSCTFDYDPYIKNNQSIFITEKLEIDAITKQVKVIRTLKTRLYSTITDLYIDDTKWNNYTSLQREEILPLNFIPIEIIPNNPNFEPSARYGKQFASILDIIAEKIMLDPLLNSGKFTINTNGVTGVVDQEISKMLASFIENDLLLVEGDPDSNFQPVDYIAGNFKGEQLTKIYDWLLTNYYKINRHHVPAIAKGAQQTQAEVAGVNIQTNASYEQMIYIREIKLTEFIIKLIKYDNAILNSRTFNIKNIDELIVDVHLPVNATLNRQLKNDEIIINAPNEEQGGQE